MADRITLLLLSALRRAIAEPRGLPLHAGKASACLFPSSSLGKQAAQRCLDDGLLQPLANSQHYILSDKGRDWLLQQATPRTVLDDLVRAVEARQHESAALIETAKQMQATLEALRLRTEQVLNQLPDQGDVPEAWQEGVVAFLDERRATEDCPLPELYRRAAQSTPELTIGRFHDGLRRLHEDERLYLHPWTGPLYALPEPSFALLIGHEIAYYASPRNAA